MKIKRFLLRYEPPGIGLEVEAEDGKCDVVHKDLPSGDEVANSCKAIKGIVDNLIAEESQLLTRRRHRNALLQLLARLYQVELDENDDEDGGALRKNGAEEEEAAAPSASIPAESETVIKEGQQVVLVGFTGKLQTRNGELAVVSKARGEKHKYEVQVGPGRAGEAAETLKVKGTEHIIPAASRGTPLAVGTHVAIRGLRNHIELNGCLGRVVECHEESHRYEVRATESGQLFRVKQENLIPIEALPSGLSKENREPNTATPAVRKAEPVLGGEGNAGSGTEEGGADMIEVGSAVQLVGLKTAMSFNGQTAEVLSVDRQRGRYEIRLAEGSVKTIRAENVRLVAPPPGAPGKSEQKTSPRPKKPKDGASGAGGVAGSSKGK